MIPYSVQKPFVGSALRNLGIMSKKRVPRFRIDQADRLISLSIICSNSYYFVFSLYSLHYVFILLHEDPRLRMILKEQS